MIHFYGTHNEDYMADPLSPIHWHCFKETAGLGRWATSRRISSIWPSTVGDIEQVCGDLKIVVPARPAKAGSAEMIAVENEDQAHAMVRFAGGAQGVIETSCRLRPQDGAVVCHHRDERCHQFHSGAHGRAEALST